LKIAKNNLIFERYELPISILRHPPKEFNIRFCVLDKKWVKTLAQSFINTGHELSTTVFLKKIIVSVNFKGKN
jgi:hypothetical protein